MVIGLSIAIYLTIGAAVALAALRNWHPLFTGLIDQMATGFFAFFLWPLCIPALIADRYSVQVVIARRPVYQIPSEDYLRAKARLEAERRERGAGCPRA